MVRKWKEPKRLLCDQSFPIVTPPVFWRSCQKVAENVIEELLLNVVVCRVGNLAIQQVKELFNAGSRKVHIMVAHGTASAVVQQKGIKSRIWKAKTIWLWLRTRIMFVSAGQQFMSTFRLWYPYLNINTSHCQGRTHWLSFSHHCQWRISGGNLIQSLSSSLYYHCTWIHTPTQIKKPLCMYISSCCAITWIECCMSLVLLQSLWIHGYEWLMIVNCWEAFKLKIKIRQQFEWNYITICKK